MSGPGLRVWLRLCVLASLALMACGPSAAEPGPAALLQRARERELPAELRARFRLRVSSPRLDLGGVSAGGLHLARPGRGKLVFFGPLGATTSRAQADGRSLALTLTRSQEHYLAPDGELVLRALTGGVVGVDDALALLVGDLPLDGAPVGDLELLPDGGVRGVLDGPEGSTVEVELDALTHLPRAISARDPQRSLWLSARYGGWTEVAGHPVPDSVVLEIAALDLTAVVQYREWFAPQGPSPAPGADSAVGLALDLAAPEGYEPASLDEALLRLVPGNTAP